MTYCFCSVEVRSCCMSVVHCLVQPDDLMSKTTAICGLVLLFGANLSEICITSVRRRPQNLPLRLNRCVSTLMYTKFTSELFRIDSSQGWLSLMCPDVVCSCDDCHHSACNLTRRFDSPGSRCFHSNEEILFIPCCCFSSVPEDSWCTSSTGTEWFSVLTPPPAITMGVHHLRASVRCDLLEIGTNRVFCLDGWMDGNFPTEVRFCPQLFWRSQLLLTEGAPPPTSFPFLLPPLFLLFFLSLSLF